MLATVIFIVLAVLVTVVIGRIAPSPSAMIPLGVVFTIALVAVVTVANSHHTDADFLLDFIAAIIVG